MEETLFREGLRVAGILVFIYVAVRAIIRKRRGTAPWDVARDEAEAVRAERFSDVREWAEERRLPLVGWEPEDTPAGDDPLASRLGGPVFRPVGSTWPTCGKGKPLQFLAQINFAEMGPLDGFPDHGVLQLFIGRDELMGLGDPEGHHADYWQAEEMAGDGAWRGWEGATGTDADAEDADADAEPFTDIAVAQEGRRLSPRPGHMAPLREALEVEQRLAEYSGRDGIERLSSLFPPRTDVSTLYTGGHPAFTQDDIRRSPAGPPLGDALVLLQLGSGAHLQWGDMGEAVFLIRPEDLAARRFDRVHFHWDCY